ALVEDLLPGIEGFPDTRTLAKAAGHAERDIVDLTLELRILHHDHIFSILLRQIVDIVLQVRERAMPTRIIAQSDDIERNIAAKHIVDKEMRLVVLAAQGDV